MHALHFRDPLYLALLGMIPLFFVLRAARRGRPAAISFPARAGSLRCPGA